MCCGSEVRMCSRFRRLNIKEKTISLLSLEKSTLSANELHIFRDFLFDIAPKMLLPSVKCSFKTNVELIVLIPSFCRQKCWFLHAKKFCRCAALKKKSRVEKMAKKRFLHLWRKKFLLLSAFGDQVRSWLLLNDFLLCTLLSKNVQTFTLLKSRLFAWPLLAWDYFKHTEFGVSTNFFETEKCCALTPVG